MVIRRQFKFWKYLSRYQFERIPIRRRYETKDVSFYTRPVPANGLLQFQRASPETEQAVVFLQPADMSAESRDQSPENDLRKIPENRMVLSKLHGWSTCVNWGGILRIQEGYIGGLHSWSSRGCWEHATPEGGCYRWILQVFRKWIKEWKSYVCSS